MRVVIVSDFGEVNGGAAKVAVTSARGLAEAGVDVTFVCAAGSASPLLNHPRIAVRCLEQDSVWNVASRASAALQGIWNRRARDTLDSILGPLDARETLVHFHQWTKSLSPSVLAAPLNRGLPSAVSLHDYFLVCPNGAYYHYPGKTPCRLTPLSPPCVFARCDRISYPHKMVRVVRQYATNWATQRAGASLSVISVSSFAENIVDGFLPKIHPRFVVRSPIAVEKSSPADVARNEGFIFAGRLTEEKGVRIAAWAAKESGLALTLSGDGPLLAELGGMDGSIHCTGWLDEAALTEAVRKSRALIFPSTWYETGGLVVLEALAQGVPVIVSRTTAAAEYVTDGANGYVVEPGNQDMLMTRMRALNDDALAARMGREAYDRYWSNPQTLEAHTAGLLAVYREILSAHRGKSRAA